MATESSAEPLNSWMCADKATVDENTVRPEEGHEH